MSKTMQRAWVSFLASTRLRVLFVTAASRSRLKSVKKRVWIVERKIEKERGLIGNVCVLNARRIGGVHYG